MASTMSRARGIHVALIPVLAFGIVMLGPAGRVARAELVSTQAVVDASAGPQDARARVRAFLERADVRAQIEAFGVDADEAAARVANLTDAEVGQIDQRLGQLPAGGSDFLVVVAAILVTILLILLITDLIGWTDVFGFINPLPPGPHR